ncbi:ribonuclease Z [Flavobacteriaceae bacterium R38]|nr:ribonuclease Z [Flavobacteriaceae bacterium R38]
MIFDKQGNTTIITQESVSFSVFLDRINDAYKKFEKDNIIINLFSFDEITVNDVLEFSQLSGVHRSKNKSFVIVTDNISYDSIPEELVLVPTLQEAFDLIEMDEIERDLGI